MLLGITLHDFLNFDWFNRLYFDEHTLPLPCLMTRSTHPAAAPGTVTVWPWRGGIGLSAVKSLFSLPRVRHAGARPLSE